MHLFYNFDVELIVPNRHYEVAPPILDIIV